MASKRMFSKQVIDSDAFLDMPLSTQALYFHLNMRADDDGFVNNPKRIMRTIGANQNDLDLLLVKRFALAFESGVIVIKHWRLHNTIRKDRYRPTVYTEEKQQIELKDNKVYTEDLYDGNHLATIRQPSGTVDKVRLDKVRLDNNTINDEKDEVKVKEETILKKKEDVIELFNLFWEHYPRKVSKKPARTWFEKNKPSKELVETMVKKLELFKKTIWHNKETTFIPHPSTWLNQERWNDEVGSDISRKGSNNGNDKLDNNNKPSGIVEL